MSYSFQIGVRYLRSKKRANVSMITLISIIGVALGVAALLAVLSITTGFENAFREVAAAQDIPWIEFFMEGVALNESLMQADGIHPNAEAQSLLLENAWPIISQSLDK